MKAEVQSETHDGKAYNVEVDPDLGRINCDCRGFGMRGFCKHVLGAIDANAELIGARARIVPVLWRLRQLHLDSIAEALSDAHPDAEASYGILTELANIEKSLNKLRGYAHAWKRE